MNTDCFYNDNVTTKITYRVFDITLSLYDDNNLCVYQ